MNPDNLAGLFRDLALGQQHVRIAVVGGPRTGKTTWCRKLEGAFEVYHTDDYRHLPWKKQLDPLIERLTDDFPWVVEGCQVARMLRRGLPATHVVLMLREHAPIGPAQRRMTRGILTIFDEWAAGHPGVPVFTPSRGT